ncbi:T9SS type B sorting domain-containing protein, partial [Flavobacterium glaciei]
AVAVGENPQGDSVQDTSGTATSNDLPTVTNLPENAKIALILKGTFKDENQDGQAQKGETFKYQYIIFNLGAVPLSDVWIQDTMVGLDKNSGTIDLPIGAIDNTTFSSTYVITQDDITNGKISSQAMAFGTTPLGMIVQDLSHDTSELKIGSTEIDVDGCQLTIFNAVSTNSRTEFGRILYIKGLDCYPKNTVQIFNRWGVKVFDVDDYDNNTKAFRGISEGRDTVNKSTGLPNGTYFYIINYVDKNGKSNNKSGYLHLIND